jgi:RNA polymerase sigma-70 factor (ECF subfamily)
MSRYREEGRANIFTELVHRYERELYRYLARYLGDPTLAEDVFQSAFLRFTEARIVREWWPFRHGSTPSRLTRRRLAAKGGAASTVSLDQRWRGSRIGCGNLLDLLVNEGAGPLAELQESGGSSGSARYRSLARPTPTDVDLAYHQDLKYRKLPRS